ncbi:hypothetical protein PV326_011260 [Microctonus aethiopoides]|nr:hypothetical protein PV326_011260 [Microctonus aethiopoides]
MCIKKICTNRFSPCLLGDDAWGAHNRSTKLFSLGALRFSSRHALETRQKRCMVLPASFMLSCSGHDRQRLESPFAHPSPSSTSPPTIPCTHRNRRTTIKKLIQPTWQQCAILYSKSHREGCYIREEILLLKVDKAYCVKN